jgi:hypothetical protein
MNSILGRFINFVLIVIHSIKSPIYGLFTCSVLIYFYQMESTIWLNEGFFECNCALNNNANMKELLLYDTNITPIIYVNKQIEFNNQIQNDYIKKL